MMWLCHGWGWQPPQTASHIHIRHIKSAWAHWYAIHGHTISALNMYTHLTWLRVWGSVLGLYNILDRYSRYLRTCTYVQKTAPSWRNLDLSLGYYFPWFAHHNFAVQLRDKVKGQFYCNWILRGRPKCLRADLLNDTQVRLLGWEVMDRYSHTNKNRKIIYSCKLLNWTYWSNLLVHLQGLQR